MKIQYWWFSCYRDVADDANTHNILTNIRYPRFDKWLVVNQAKVDDLPAVGQTRSHSLVAITGGTVGHLHQLMHTADAWVNLRTSFETLDWKGKINLYNMCLWKHQVWLCTMGRVSDLSVTNTETWNYNMGVEKGLWHCMIRGQRTRMQCNVLYPAGAQLMPHKQLSNSWEKKEMYVFCC